MPSPGRLDAGHSPDADDGVGPGGGGVHVGAGHGPVDGALLHPCGDLLVVRHDHLLQAVRWESRISDTQGDIWCWMLGQMVKMVMMMMRTMKMMMMVRQPHHRIPS